MTFNCKRCGSDRMCKKGKASAKGIEGRQKRYCNDCNRISTEGCGIRGSDTPPCVECSSSHTVRKGYSGGKQRYLCKMCGKKYTDSTRSESFKRSVVLQSIRSSMDRVSKKYGIGNNTVRRWMDRYRSDVIKYL